MYNVAGVFCQVLHGEVGKFWLDSALTKMSTMITDALFNQNMDPKLI